MLVSHGAAADAARCGRAPTIKIIAESNSNANSATAVDFVFIADKAVLPLLDGLTAADYFARKDALQASLVNSIHVVSLEIPPAIILEPKRVRGCFAGAFIFANYLSPGAHRLAITSASPAELRLGPYNFTWSPIPPRDNPAKHRSIP